MDVNLSKLRETVKDRGVWHAGGHEIAESDTTQRLSTTTTRLQGNANRSTAKKTETWRPPCYILSCVTNSGSEQECGCSPRLSGIPLCRTLQHVLATELPLPTKRSCYISGNPVPRSRLTSLCSPMCNSPLELHCSPTDTERPFFPGSSRLCLC